MIYHFCSQDSGCKKIVPACCVVSVEMNYILWYSVFGIFIKMGRAPWKKGIDQVFQKEALTAG